MKYNSIHKFDNFNDAQKFIKAISNAGFRAVSLGRDGGVVYSNGKHKMMVCTFGV